MSASFRVIPSMLALFFSLPGFGQYPDNPISYPDRYCLNLPAEWKRHKLILAITEILPQTIDELKDRDFCTAGKAAFYVTLVMDSLQVMNAQTTQPVEIGSIPHYTFSFNYNFHAALLVTDSLRKPVTMLQLMSLDETLSYQKQFSLPRQNVVYRYVTVYDSRGRPVGTRLVEEAGAVNTYVPEISPYSVLTRDYLLNICEKKIYEIRRMLKKLNEE